MKPADDGPGRALTVDVDRWPIVILRWVGSPGDEEIATHLREIEERVLGREEDFIQIIDQAEGAMPNALQRQLIAEHQERMNAAYARYCRGEAYISNSEFRLAMKAVFWCAPPPYPHAFFDTIDEALEWARRRLSRAN